MSGEYGLVLSRKKGEQIYIGPDIVVTVVDVRTTNVARIAVKAPRSVRVVRAELEDQGDLKPRPCNG